MAGDVPKIMLPYQGELIAAINRHQFVIEEKSRRIGMTWAVASEAVLTSGKRKADKGMDTLYIGYNLDMAKEFIDTCAQFVRAMYQIEAQTTEFDYIDRKRGEVDRYIKAFRIDFPSGFSIVALTSNPRSLRGRQGFLIFDEAAFHDDLPGMIKAGMAFLIRGGKVLIISTHDGEDNAFNELIQQVRSGKRKGVVLRHTFDEAVDQGLYESIARLEGWPLTPEAKSAWIDGVYGFYGDDADEELRCIPSKGTGIYLPRAMIKSAMTPQNLVARLHCPDGFERRGDDEREGFVRDWYDDHVRPALLSIDRRRRSFIGQDFARSSDLTVIAIGVETQKLLLDVPVMIELRNCPFREQESLMHWIIADLGLFMAAVLDARGNGQALAEALQQDYGFDRVEAAMATQATYLDGFPRLKGRLEDRTIMLPQDQNIEEDLRAVKLVRGVPGIPERTGSGKEKRHGDGAIALMNLVRATLIDVTPMEVQKLGRTRPALDAYADVDGGGVVQVTSRGFGTVRLS